MALFGDALEQDSDAMNRLFRINIMRPPCVSRRGRNMPEGGHYYYPGSVNGDRMPVPGMAAYAPPVNQILQRFGARLARDLRPHAELR